MKRFQILRASIVVLAIGGAIASKANTRDVITRFTVASTPGLPCEATASPCGMIGILCQTGMGSSTITYYHESPSKLCGKTLKMLQ